jgi:hypothetical protein
LNQKKIIYARDRIDIGRVERALEWFKVGNIGPMSVFRGPAFYETFVAFFWESFLIAFAVTAPVVALIALCHSLGLNNLWNGNGQYLTISIYILAVAAVGQIVANWIKAFHLKLNRIVGDAPLLAHYFSLYFSSLAFFRFLHDQEGSNPNQVVENALVASLVYGFVHAAYHFFHNLIHPSRERISIVPSNWDRQRQPEDTGSNKAQAPPADSRQVATSSFGDNDLARRRSFEDQKKQLSQEVEEIFARDYPQESEFFKRVSEKSGHSFIEIAAVMIMDKEMNFGRLGTDKHIMLGLYGFPGVIEAVVDLCKGKLSGLALQPILMGVPLQNMTMNLVSDPAIRSKFLAIIECANKSVSFSR